VASADAEIERIGEVRLELQVRRIRAQFGGERRIGFGGLDEVDAEVLDDRRPEQVVGPQRGHGARKGRRSDDLEFAPRRIALGVREVVSHRRLE
jgi:hypothetical protein